MCTYKKTHKTGNYFKTGVEDIQTAVPKMTALDGVHFKVCTTSETLRKLFKKSNYDLLQSPNAVKCFMAKCDQL